MQTPRRERNMAVAPTTTIGQVSEKVKNKVKWKIYGGRNFYSLQDVYESRRFYFAEVEWVMKLERDRIIKKYFIELIARSRAQDIEKIKCTMFKKVEIEIPCDVHRSTKGFKTDNPIIDMSKLESKNCTITIKCILEIQVDPDSSAGTAECSYCKQMVNADTIDAHQKRCGHKPILCPNCLKRLLLCQDHQCPQAETNDEILENLYRLCLEEKALFEKHCAEIQNESEDSDSD